MAASAVLTIKPRMDGDRLCGFARGERPGVGEMQALKGDAIMHAEFARTLRRTARSKIGRAAADNAANCADPACDQAAVGQGADPHREIDMLLQQVDHAVGQNHPDVDVRVGLEELHHDRKDVQTAEDDGRGDDQIAFRRAVFARCRALSFAHVLKDALARRDIGSPRIGQCQSPARPV